MEHKGNGDFTQDVFDYETVTNIDQLSFTQNKLTYLSKAKILFEGAISIMQKESKYTFKENNFKINDLGIKFDGWLMNKANNPMSMDIKFKADKTDFKSVLSLVPAIFAKDFDKIKTSGTFNLAGNAKGIYKENWYPAFNIDLIVNNGKFQYPSLPTAISNIEIETHLQNPGGSLDKLQVKIPKWNMLVGSDPVAMKLNVTTPISDPNIDLMAKGKMDLSKVKNFYPMDNVKTLTGLMNLDLDIKTKLSSVKNKQFDQVKAAGFMQIFGLNYASKDVAKPVQISALEMKFNPQFVELTKCAAKIGQSDFALTGRLDNVIGYMFAKGEVMKGNVHLASNFINANEFLSDSASAAKSAETKTLQNSDEYVKVPDNIDFTGSATINRILYDKINLTAVSGDIRAYDESVTLNATKANLLGGNVQVKGVYTTKNLDKPTGTLSYNIQNFDMKQVFEYVGMAKKLAPILQYVDGNFSSDMNIDSKLNPDMSVDMNSLTGTATFSIPNASVKNFPALKNIAELTKLSQLNNLNLNNVQVKMKIQNGRVVVDPFDVKAGNMNIKVAGSQGIDQTIDYIAGIDVPWAELGAASTVADGLLAKSPIPGITNSLKPEILRFNLNVGGTFAETNHQKMGKPEAVKGSGQTGRKCGDRNGQRAIQRFETAGRRSRAPYRR
ncbi:MAG: AsmA-like C-terminal region-containing protein [Bacteroidetes bacterium]|nr:AsmA-like C-terminal region-containing protein [Bacteroidota bacterium]